MLNESLQEGTISTQELRGVADKLGTASQSIVKLVSGIKTYARIEQTDPVPIDLNSAIQGSLDLVSFLYRQDNIELKNGLSNGSPMILGNIGKLQQVADESAVECTGRHGIKQHQDHFGQYPRRS